MTGGPVVPGAAIAPAGSTAGYAPSARVPHGTPCALLDPWLEIDTRHLAANLAQVRRQVGDRPIMAVVKCNAYGHGVVGIARALQELGVAHFAVVKVQEAVALREHGITGTILNFGPFCTLEAETLVRHDISQSVFSDAVDDLAGAARRLGRPARVHVKVDTGLSRVGVPHEHAPGFVERVAAIPDLRIEGVFTTLAQEPDFDPVQVERLRRVCDAATRKGIPVGLRHAASTSGLVGCPPAYLDMVRPGSCLYGLEPLPGLALEPVLALKTRVILVKPVHPGDTIAYHRRRTVERPMRLATLPLGYSDGYPFQAIDRGEALIRGRRWPLIVYMSANHCFADVTDGPDIALGDEVVLFGRQGPAEITLAEVARWGGSSVYKVASAMSPVLPRIYLE